MLKKSLTIIEQRILVIMNLENFEIVSDFDIRYSDLIKSHR